MSQDMWFPSLESRNVVGRYTEVESVDPVKSREAGEEILMTRIALESKVVGSHDASVQVVKPFNAKELQKRFPGAWEFFEAKKAKRAAVITAAVEKGEEPEPVEEPEIQLTIDGTPLDKADFLPRDRMPWLAMQGVQTIEQIRDLSDQQVMNMGQGVGKWRKQAKAFLERT